MGENKKKDLERFWSEYDQVSSKDKWTKDDIELMKNLLKCLYYKKVVCAMDEAEEYDEGDYASGMSYASRGPRRNMNTGRYMPSGSGAYPMNGPYYDNRPDRRYYDDQKQMAIHRFESMAEAERDPEMRAAMQELVRMVQNR